VVLGSQRDLGRAVNGLPGAGGDRRLGVEAVVPHFAHQRSRDRTVTQQAAAREGSGDQIPGVAFGCPAGPGALEEFDVAGVVGAQDGFEAKILRLDDLAQVLRLHTGQHGVRAAGHLEAGLQFAVDQFGLAEMQAVIIAVHGKHGSTL